MNGISWAQPAHDNFTSRTKVLNPVLQLESSNVGALALAEMDPGALT